MNQGPAVLVGLISYCAYMHGTRHREKPRVRACVQVCGAHGLHALGEQGLLPPAGQPRPQGMFLSQMLLVIC